MRGKLKKEGNYELFETSKGHPILSLDNKNWFAVVEGRQRDIQGRSKMSKEELVKKLGK